MEKSPILRIKSHKTRFSNALDINIRSIFLLISDDHLGLTIHEQMVFSVTLKCFYMRIFPKIRKNTIFMLRASFFLLFFSTSLFLSHAFGSSIIFFFFSLWRILWSFSLFYRVFFRSVWRTVWEQWKANKSTGGKFFSSPNNVSIRMPFRISSSYS